MTTLVDTGVISLHEFCVAVLRVKKRAASATLTYCWQRVGVSGRKLTLTRGDELVVSRAFIQLPISGKVQRGNKVREINSKREWWNRARVSRGQGLDKLLSTARALTLRLALCASWRESVAEVLHEGGPSLCA